MQKNRNIWTIKKIIFLFAILCLLAKLIFDFSGFWSNFASVFEYIGYILSYLLFGFVIAYILNAYIDFWDKKLLRDLLNKNKKVKKAICIIIAYLTFFGILSFLIFTLVPTLTTTLRDFIKMIPNLIDEGMAFYTRLLDGTRYEISEDVIKSSKNAIDTLLNSFIGTVNISVITNILSNTTAWMFNFVMGIIVSVYMLIEKDNTLIAINRIIDGLFSRRAGERLRWIGHEINQIFRKYFTGKLLQALICTVLAYIAFTIARVPYAILFAVIFGITNMIPYVGPWIGAVPVILVCLVYDFWLGVSAAICILTVQAVDNWFISPKIVGGKMGISPLLVLAGLGIGGKLFGFPGLIFGDVLAAIFKLFFYDVYIDRRIEAKKIKYNFDDTVVEEEVEETDIKEEEIVETEIELEKKPSKLDTVKVSIKERVKKIFKKN